MLRAPSVLAAPLALAAPFFAAAPLLAALAACYDTPQPPCAFACGQGDDCPTGYSCRPDAWCKRDDVADDRACQGMAPDLDPDDAAGGAAADASPADASPPDASPPDASGADAAPPDASQGAPAAGAITISAPGSAG
jgi:hypothetical protein